MPNREISTYYNTLTYLLNNLKAKQRGLTTFSASDPNNENIWKTSKGWLILKDVDSDSHVLAIQKYYDVSSSTWIRRSNVFADIDVDRVFTNIGLRDRYLSSNLLISESGVTALHASFSAGSIVGCLNELKAAGAGSGVSSFWLASGIDTVKPKSPYNYIHTKSGLKDDYASGIKVGESGHTSLNASFNASSIIGALNEIQQENAAVDRSGFPVDRGVTLSFNNSTRTLTVTDGGSATYLINGENYTLGGNKTVVLSNTNGLWYVYFSGSTLIASQTEWDIADNDKALVCVIFWNTTDSEAILLSYRLHDYIISPSTHKYLCQVEGMQWSRGLEVTEATSERVNISNGVLYNADILVNIINEGSLFGQTLQPAQMNIFYRNSVSDYKKYSKAQNTDIGAVDGSNNLLYNLKSGVNYATSIVTSGYYVAMYILGTSDINNPVMLVMGQREDVNLAEAKDNNDWSNMDDPGGFLDKYYVLARVIIKESASSPYYTIEDIQDLRHININDAKQPSVTSVSPATEKEFSYSIYDSDETVVVSDGTTGLVIPSQFNNFQLDGVIVRVYVKGSGGATEVQIRRNRNGTNVDMLSSKVSLGDVYFSDTCTINTSNSSVQTGDLIFVDVDTVHSTTSPIGLFVTLKFKE
jgi:hypothetical protein